MCVPTVRLLVEYVAAAVPVLRLTAVPVPMLAPPSLNVTVPVGVDPPLPTIVAVRVTAVA